MAERHLAPVTTDLAPDLFSDARIKLIKQQVANGAPDQLFAAMIEIARTRGLDPLAKQISLINFGGTWQITTTIDGYRALAEQTGAYAGSDAAVFVEDGNTIISASVTVWKMVGGQRVPFTATVYWSEYNAGNFTWKKMPRTMLAKVAESHALRKAFPSTLSGMYTADEMAQAGPVQDQPPRIQYSGVLVDAETGNKTYPDGRVEIIDHDTGEITAPLVTEKGLTALWALCGERKVSSDDLHAIIKQKYGHTSTKQLNVDEARELYRVIKAEDEDGLASIVWEAHQAAQDAPTDAVFSEVES